MNDETLETLSLHGLEVQVWISELDGVTVVQIDTEDHVGRFRINVNDAPVWDADPETNEGPMPTRGSTCLHCERPIFLDDHARWIDPEAKGDDVMWRETCDRNDTERAAPHRPGG